MKPLFCNKKHINVSHITRQLLRTVFKIFDFAVGKWQHFCPTVIYLFTKRKGFFFPVTKQSLTSESWQLSITSLWKLRDAQLHENWFSNFFYLYHHPVTLTRLIFLVLSILWFALHFGICFSFCKCQYFIILFLKWPCGSFIGDLHVCVVTPESWYASLGSEKNGFW